MSISLTSGGQNYTSIVTRTQAKTHLRVDGTDDDTLIDALINAAGERAEVVTGKQFWTAVRVLRMDTWHDPDYRRDRSPDIYIPLPPLQSISSVVYTDNDGVTQTWSTSDYVVDIYHEPGRVRPAYNVSLPTIRDGIHNAIAITYSCGYGTNATNVPASIGQGMLLQIGAHYKFREDVISGVSISKLPDNIAAMSLWMQEGILEAV